MDTSKKQRRWELYITLGIVLVSFLIRLIRLDVPHDWSFDEVYHGLSAEAYALNDPRGYEWWNQSPKDLAYEWLHPPLGKLFMAASINVFSKPYIPESKSAPLSSATTFAWRFPGIIFAALTVFLLIKFGKELFNNFWIGAASGGLYALDGLSFVQSRTGMNDIYIAFFVVLTFYRLFRLIKDGESRLFFNLFWLGIAAGLAASTKWTGFYAVGIVFVWGMVHVLKKRGVVLVGWMLLMAGLVFLRLDNLRVAYEQLAATLVPFIVFGSSITLGIIFWNNKESKKTLFTLLGIAILPVVVYFLSYSQWWIQGHTGKQFYELHQQTWWYQTGLKATHGYQSQALTWPILYRPVWFYVKYQDVFKDSGEKELYIGNIYTMGHPFIWWAGIVGVGFVGWQFVVTLRKRVLDGGRHTKSISTSHHKFGSTGKNQEILKQVQDHVSLPLSIILVGYFGMFLPWVASPRIMFMYHYLPSVPFLCLALAYGLDRIRNGSIVGKQAVIGYLILVVIGFIYFYPHWSALPLPQAWTNQYFWLPSWK